MALITRADKVQFLDTISMMRALRVKYPGFISKLTFNHAENRISLTFARGEDQLVDVELIAAGGKMSAYYSNSGKEALLSPSSVVEECLREFVAWKGADDAVPGALYTRHSRDRG